MLKRLVLASVLILPAAAVWAQSPGPDAATSSRCFELRTYSAAPGKTRALHARFRDHTTAIFATHGMEVVAYWIPIETADRLVYVLAHESCETARRNWEAFRTDPDWIEAKAASEIDGPLTAKVESLFLGATDYSPLK